MSQRRTQRKFVCTGRVHLVAEAEDHRPWTFGCPITAEPRCAIAHNGRNVCQRFDVINGGGLSKKSGCSWVGGVWPGVCPPSLQGLQGRRNPPPHPKGSSERTPPDLHA